MSSRRDDERCLARDDDARMLTSPSMRVKGKGASLDRRKKRNNGTLKVFFSKRG